MIAFGPVPSRRLGRSLGINHVPPKVCTYSCVYCQVGRTTRLRSRSCSFLEPSAVVDSVVAKLEAARRVGQPVDYLTFVPDGEPTLEAGLGAMIQALWPLGIPIAVVTNGSLLDRAAVREALARADWVSLKVDTVDEARWRQVNRPHGRLRLERILDGMGEFAAGFRGHLVTETMLLSDVNDAEAELRATASFIGDLKPATAYLSVPTRPPAESWVRPATAASVARAYEVFRGLAGPTELLVGYEGDGFEPTGDPREDLLAITSVHPMREHAAARFLGRAGVSQALLADLVRGGELVRVAYGGHHYLLRPTAPPAREPSWPSRKPTPR
jgi:wyosine [tRNA(Phe)-imidazoG37] synthetase (radical SAM superfamily)